MMTKYGTKEGNLEHSRRLTRFRMLRDVDLTYQFGEYPHAPGNLEPEATPDLIGAIKSLGFKDYETLLAVLNAAVQGTIDDNELLLERLIQLLSKLPTDSKAREQITDGLITQLWNSLDHPPVTPLSSEFRYRSADGSGNNINHPELGAANRPYARTVPPLTFQNPSQPDPSTVFDTLMVRGDTFQPHPQGISSMMFYLGTLIIHDCFQTSSSDYNINLTSSYLDLSPLYGRNETEQKAMRTFENGLIKPDCFSSKRILGFPPGCSVFLIMFNRFHNYVVTQLAKINENGRFDKPSQDAGNIDWEKYDNDLFQTGRLITCGLYANIIIHDYARSILALNHVDTTWSLEPRIKSGKNMFSQPSPRGVGNQVSVEFNLLYRWHSTVSQRDEKWTIDEFKRLLDGKDPNKATLPEVLNALAKFDRGIPDEPENRRGLGGLVRQADGTFDDDGLVRILTESIEDIAGSFGANRVPSVFKTVEMLGIKQARYWNVATLNEFRSFIGLTKHATFEDINPDPVVAKKLKDLYDSPDAVEMYPGLVIEKAKPPISPGSGFCTNYTISKAILSDAVSLVRGDRFFTLDYTPKNLTNWGYNEPNSDPKISQSHVMHKLIFRAFPNHFQSNSIYAHYPFVNPSKNGKIYENLGTSFNYSWDKPQRQTPPVVIKSYKTAKSILSNSTTPSNLPWHADPSTTRQVTTKTAVTTTKSQSTSLARFCNAKIAHLLQMNSIPILSPSTGDTHNEVDIIHDVLSPVTTQLFATIFNLPLKTPQSPHGIYSEHELFNVLTTIAASVFPDVDGLASAFRLRQTARWMADKLGRLIVNGLKDHEGLVGELLEKVEGLVHGHSEQSEDEVELRGLGKRIMNGIIVREGGDVKRAVWGPQGVVVGVAVGVADQVRLLGECLDFYLGDGRGYLPEVCRLAKLDNEEGDQGLTRYMLEGVRLRGSGGTYRELRGDMVVEDFETDAVSKSLKAGEMVLIDLVAVSRDAGAFPEPDKVRLDRDLESYLHLDVGSGLLGAEAGRVILTAVFKAVVRLEGLQRVEGPRGQLNGFPAMPSWSGQVRNELGGSHYEESGLRTYLTADQRAFTPLPSTMRVSYQ
ncbi:putative linoleate diol synthase [Triangularia verruculosa]|uniref:Linoleate diol synthase n=1 Tax=Triangularia verruculosa TaxID=2587418 RepID=A0AAN7AQ38_9PEZI|nr:putative linoleate diol synthase [Triangularia verruculosa]